MRYNQDTVDHLRLSVDYPADESQGPGGAPDIISASAIEEGRPKPSPLGTVYLVCVELT